jgi:glutathione S-transferase
LLALQTKFREAQVAEQLDLHGYRYSVYTRSARLALLWKNVEHQTLEADPFAELPEDYLGLHPC